MQVERLKRVFDIDSWPIWVLDCTQWLPSCAKKATERREGS
jgi:hypothetical protein